ncbi:alginate lyase family protein [Microvirga sp. 2TAF3]|uniref:heparinase II/III family protein n=1 Tax=Microvirga sp. 2TAF3 TaxID=3233014 RepID=UPI003F94825F
MASALHAPWPVEAVNAIRDTELEIEAGTLTLLGVSWPVDLVTSLAPELWFTDPITMEKWPGVETFCFDVEYRYPERCHDVKFIWELNRLQFLQPIAAMNVLDPSPKRVAWIMEILSSWMEANPPFRGLNWASGIEVALRLVSVAFVVACVSDHLSKEHKRQLRSFVAAHVFWLHRNPSLFSSANNHHVAEGLGLVTGALLVPDLACRSIYLSQGAEILRQAPHSQFYSDGIGVEQTPSYAAFTLEMLAVGALVLDDVPADIRFDRNSLERPAHALKAFLDDNGIAPNIGDNDEGHVIAGPLCREARYVASVVAAVAGLLNKPDLAPAARDFQLRNILLQSPASIHTREEHFTHFTQGGYSIFHGTISGRRVHLTYDYGPLGFGPIAAHGHADALALWLTIDNFPVLVDAGTYLYHAGRERREFLRSSAAHNTLQINGQSQSLTSGAFNWHHKAASYPTLLEQGPNWKLKAQHDGFLRRFGVIHERTIERNQSDIFVKDRLFGSEGQFDTTICFLLDPNITIKSDSEGLLLLRNGAPLARFIPPPSDELESMEFFIEKSPFSCQFGTLSEATRIRINTKIDTQETLTVRISIIPSDDHVDELSDFTTEMDHFMMNTKSGIGHP